MAEEQLTSWLFIGSAAHWFERRRAHLDLDLEGSSLDEDAPDNEPASFSARETERFCKYGKELDTFVFSGRLDRRDENNEPRIAEVGCSYTYYLWRLGHAWKLPNSED